MPDIVRKQEGGVNELKKKRYGKEEGMKKRKKENFTRPFTKKSKYICCIDIF